MRDGKRFDPFIIFLAVACIGLAVAALLLAQENRALKARVGETDRPAADQAATLKPGDRVKPFAVVDGSGRPSTVGFGGGETKTILLVFSSTCPACQETIPRWKSLFSAGPSAAVRIVAVRTDNSDAGSPAADPLREDLPFPVYSYARSDADLMAKVPFIPAAVVVDGEGVVTKIWFGVPSREQEEELLRELAMG